MIRPVVAGSGHPTPLIDSAVDSTVSEQNLRTVKKMPEKYHDPALVQAAQGMEALFLDYMMKVMRETVPKNEMDLESHATEIYRGMLDSELAERTAKSRGVGLADQIIDYMEAKSYNQRSSSPPGTGGTHEGK